MQLELDRRKLELQKINMLDQKIEVELQARRPAGRGCARAPLRAWSGGWAELHSPLEGWRDGRG